MPGTYLAAILLSAAGVLALDLRWRLVVPHARWRAAAAIGLGTVFFLAWDIVGIATGVFVKGDSPLYIGIVLAPHLPLEEIVFLMFLSYLALIVHSAALRMATALSPRKARSE